MRRFLITILHSDALHNTIISVQPPCRDGTEVFLCHQFKTIIQMVNYDLVVQKKWRDFIIGIRYGEVAQFTVTSKGDIDSLRTVAARVNTELKNDFMYSVEGNTETLRCQVFTKPRL